MKKHNVFGKIIFWLGFFLFILGVSVNGTVGIVKDAPDIVSYYSLPALIVGVLLLLISNGFKKEEH
ncbi:hypothetical protein [Sediminibacillus massiliensis]|uniref:hypothetical protein n=1 Tax=Sediminibacillus massiliensis TaxID=1926277 RepID=UPI0009883D90|nr:hypothetical protein [Sediminibacillus massiliensis]